MSTSLIAPMYSELKRQGQQIALANAADIARTFIFGFSGPSDGPLLEDWLQNQNNMLGFNQLISNKDDMGSIASLYGPISAIVASEVAMDAIVANSIAMDAIVASQVAMDAIFSSSISRQAVWGSTFATQLIFDSSPDFLINIASVHSVSLSGTSFSLNISSGKAWLLRFGHNGSNISESGDPINFVFNTHQDVGDNIYNTRGLSQGQRKEAFSNYNNLTISYSGTHLTGRDWEFEYILME